MSATPDNTLANPDQRIADLERQLAASNAERDKAQAREAALAEVLQVINSSPDDLAPVFNAMLDRALELCGAAFGSLWTYDGERVHAVALRGQPPDSAKFLQGTPHPVGPDNAHGRLLRGEPVVHIADVADDEAYRTGDPLRRNLVELGGGRTLLAVPLRKEGRFLGDFVIYRREVRPFLDKEIALLENFAAQAVIAMENARLLTETREALEQQTATAEVLGVINSSPGDLAPVFEAILERALAVCGAAFGQLGIYDGDVISLGAVRGPPDIVAFLKNRGPVRAVKGQHSTIDRLATGENIIHLADAKDDIAYRDGNPNRRALVDRGGCRTLLDVALRKEEKLLGAIEVYRQEVRPFTDKEIALLQNFAAQAVIAMENARLITETREALEQQTATAEVLQVINSSPGDLAPVFDAILEKAHTLCGAAHGDLTLADGDNFRAVAMRGLPEAFAEVLGQPFPPRRGFHDRLLSGYVQIADLTAAEFSSDSSVHRAAIGPGGVRTLLAVPLRKDGRLLGYIAANRQEVRPFTDKQIALLENFAAQAVIAMENARLLDELRHRTGDLEEALEQQTATAEVLQVINSSPGDLAPVFDAMLDKALRLCGADFGALRGFDGEAFPVLAVHGLATHGAIKPEPDSALGCLLRGENVVHIPDVIDTDGYRSGLPSRIALVQNTGARTALWVALRKEQELRGAFITTGAKFARSPTNRSPCCRTSPPRR